ncbi:MAG TPA: ACT domain-containing protein, partial [Gemmatimonadales bacterium]|nr:ACT domain-containing protein [Gemmatimonadales bacterium]
PQARPSQDWLKHVRTGRARHKIKQWIEHEEERVSLQLGEEILARELKRRRLDPPAPEAHVTAAKALGYNDGKDLHNGLGKGDIGIGKVIRGLYPDLPDDEIAEPKPTAFGKVIDRIRLGRGIKIQGVDGLMVRYAQCCQPLPGEPVVGYVTQGRGISIHRADCPNLLTLPSSDRRVEIDWQEAEGESFAVRLAVSGDDRRGLYADLMQVISASGTNIRAAEIHSKDGTMFGSVTLEVDNLPHLTRVLKAMRKVKGVAEVERREAGNG